MDTRALRKWLPYFGFVICLLVGMFGMQFHARGAGWLLEIGALAVAVLSFAAVFLMDLRSTEKLSRVPRKTFWTFMGALFAVSLFVWQIILALPEGWTDQHQHPIIATIIAISVFILGWAGIIASVIVQVRRWHDINASGWWILINGIPYLGQAVAIIACGFIPGTRGPNRFGPDPLGRTPRPQPKPVLPQGEQAAITVARSLDQYEEQPKPNSPPPPPPPVPVAASQPAAVSSENGEVTGMTNTRSGLPQKGRWKWVVIGIVGGVTLAVVVANVIRFRTVRWDTKSVSVVWSEAYDRFNEENGELRHAAFVLNYALQNNTDHDITIPESVTIMQQLTKGGVLVAYSNVAKLDAPTFLPAHQRAQLSVALRWGCGEWDIRSKTILKEEAPEACYARCFADSDGLVLFDHANHLEISLPKPIFRQRKR